MKKSYLLRLDDASEYMNIAGWMQIEALLEQYNIKPLVGIIPDNQDLNILRQYEKDGDFASRISQWKEKDWSFALHGDTHELEECGYTGLNPVNPFSEFVGKPLELQKEKIRNGLMKLNHYGIIPQVFFAPAHTYDENTLEALRQESNIRVICDTIAWDVYKKDEFYYLPQQTGKTRNLPFRFITFCYHPNTMGAKDFQALSEFLQAYHSNFIDLRTYQLLDCPLRFYDKVISSIYFEIRVIRRGIKALVRTDNG